MNSKYNRLFARLYLDEDVHKRVANAPRIRGFDVISAHEMENWGIPDQQQLEYAISQERSLVTFNVGDYAIFSLRIVMCRFWRVIPS